MEYPVSLQALQLGLAALLGIAIGLHYDILRSLRRWKRRLTIVLDFWFGLTTLLWLCLFALYVFGGRFHLFLLLGCLGGSLLYFLLCSAPVLRFLALVGRGIRLALSPVKKVFSFLKKGFSFLQKYAIIFIKYTHRGLGCLRNFHGGRSGSR